MWWEKKIFADLISSFKSCRPGPKQAADFSSNEGGGEKKIKHLLTEVKEVDFLPPSSWTKHRFYFDPILALHRADRHTCSSSSILTAFVFLQFWKIYNTASNIIWVISWE